MNLPSVAVAIGATALVATAQCTLQSVATGVGVPSVGAAVYGSTMWDPDGAGPLAPRLVVGGAFQVAGDLVANSIAAFDPVTSQWSSLGAFDGQPWAFVVVPGGTLLAAGLFNIPGGAATLMAWNGASWQPFAPQPPGGVARALALLSNGDLVAAMVQNPTASVQRLVGGNWQAFGAATLVGAAEVNALAIAANGDLVAGGRFTALGGVQAANVARWNGTAWAPLGPGVSGRVNTLLARSNGDIVAGGLFALAGAVTPVNIAQWNGSAWSGLGSGTQGALPTFAGVRTLAALQNGEVVAGGQFNTAGGIAAAKVARWNGTAWSPMGAGIEPYGLLEEPSQVLTLTVAPSGDVFAGGTFETASGRDATGLARWNGAAWGPLRARGIGRATTVVHRAANSVVYVGGPFFEIDGVVHNGIAAHVGSAWVPLGSGITPLANWMPDVRSIVSLANGDVVVGGGFPGAGGIVAPGIAAWNGTTWQPLGSGIGWFGFSPQVEDLHVAANGELVAAGRFDSAGGLAVASVARWNGSSWSAIGAGLTTIPGIGPPALTCVTTTGAGEVFVGGWFTLGGYGGVAKIGRWDGGSWALIGVLDDQVTDLLTLPNGDVLAAGAFTQINGQPFARVARWSNGSWSAVGAGVGTPTEYAAVQRLEQLPGGGLVAAGVLVVGGVVQAFARWDGATWTAFGADLVAVQDFAVDPAGELLAVGTFQRLGANVSAYFARVVTPCPASAVATAAGCTGSGGPNVLTTSSLPWLGSPFVAQASGMPAGGLALAVYGLGTLATPLATILPQGGAGCSLLVTPDLLVAHVLLGNVLQVSLPLPVAPSLVGAVVHQQVVPLEFAPAGALVALTATNRLTLTLGMF